MLDDDSVELGFRQLLERFEAIARKLDSLWALNAADGDDPQIKERLEKARALALRGSSKLREHLDQGEDEQFQRFG